jgi:hypothetical protein
MSEQERFARSLRGAERRLRAAGMSGRAAYNALVRHLARRLELPEALWPPGADAPPSAGLDQVPVARGVDLFGLAYERFFPDLFKGQRGQYFTPRPVATLMAKLAGVGPGDSVLDPTCGAGGFLLAARARGAEVTGLEIDPDLVSLARINLALVGADPAAVRRGDVYRSEGLRASVVLANPPFSVPIGDPSLLESYELARGRRSISSDALFVEAAWRMLEPGGRLCVVMPWSLLVGAGSEALRGWLDELPEGAFRPFGGTATRACVLLLRRRPAPPALQLVCRVHNPGYDPTRSDYLPRPGGELEALERALEGGGLGALDAAWVAEGGAWPPGAHLDVCTIAASRRRVPLGALVRPAGGALDPTTEAGAFTEIDLADLDKTTGEVAGARARDGAEFRPGQAKRAFEEGDLLFGRMRPNLNNVGVASRPRPGLPPRLVGSSEWIPLRADTQPWFALLALRSPFVREQLRTTGGQTRPRARADSLPQIEVPDPGPELRARLDALVGEIHQERHKLRLRLAEIEAIYAAWGRGEVSEADLIAALSAFFTT